MSLVTATSPRQSYSSMTVPFLKKILSDFSTWQEWKTVHTALADSLGLGISSRDRKLRRQKSRANPGASLKHAALSISFNHRRDAAYAGGGGDEMCGFIQSTSPFIAVQHPSLPEVLFYRPRAAQVRVTVGAGWCVWDQDIRVNNPKDLIHLTSTAYKSTNRRPSRSQKGK